MAESRFVYVTYIRTTPEKLWQALIDPEFTRQYWCETVQDCEWKPGSSWRLMIPDGRVGDSGEILEIEPLRRIVLKWRNEFKPELRVEGYSRLTYELEQQGDSVKLTVIHEMDKPGLEAHRRRVARLARDPLQPQEPARNGRIAGGYAEVAEGGVIGGRLAKECRKLAACSVDEGGKLAWQLALRSSIRLREDDAAVARFASEDAAARFFRRVQRNAADRDFEFLEQLVDRRVFRPVAAARSRRGFRVCRRLSR